MSPKQPELFDAFPEPAGAASGNRAGPAGAMVHIGGPAARLSKAQKDFNRASDKLRRLHEHLAAWQAAQAQAQQRAAAELAPLQTRLCQRHRELVLWIDAHLRQPPKGEKVSRSQRAKLVNLLRLLAGEVLQAGPDADVEAAHDRHSPVSHREQQQDEADLAASVLGRMVGDESLFEGEAASVDELVQRAAQRMAQRAAAADDDKAPETAAPDQAPPGRPGRSQQAALRQAQVRKEASQSVREVYRRLASSLHPDREADPAERTRKTALMARVNEAYAREDLHALLQVQLDIEQIDASHLAGISDDRLRHYTHVLKEQQQVVLQELEMLQMPLADGPRPPGGLAWPARWLLDALADDIDQVQEALQRLEHDAPLLMGAATRAHFLRHLQVDDPDDEMDPFEEMLLMEALDDLARNTPAPGPGVARKSGQPAQGPARKKGKGGRR